MKTKNVYVYLVLFPDGTLESMSCLSLPSAQAEREHDRLYLGFRCSPIVKIAVPLPEAPR